MGETAERAARRGEDEAPHGSRRRAGQALEDRAVLRIDGQEGHAVRPRGLRHQRPGHDQGLLVGQRDRAAGTDRRQRRQETRPADRRRQDDVCGNLRRDGPHPRRAGEDLGSRGRELAGQPIDRGPVEQRDGHRSVRPDLLDEERQVRAAGRQPTHPELARELGDELEGSAADRAGRSQHGHRLHVGLRTSQHPSSPPRTPLASGGGGWVGSQSWPRAFTAWRGSAGNNTGPAG